MNGRTFNERAMPDNAMGATAEYPVPVVEPDWVMRDRVLLDFATRLTRLMTWMFALMTVILCFLIAVSAASDEFDKARPSVEEIFPNLPANPGDTPNTVP